MPSSPAVVRSTSLYRDPLKANFKNFVHKAWRTWFDADPQPIMYDFADRLQYGPDKDILMGYRGLSKSYLVVTFCGFNHHCDPEMIILNLAGSGKAATGNAALYWGMINTFDWLSHLKPSGILRHSSLAFDVAGSKMEKSESFASLGLFSGDKTGRRCDLGIPDDVETPTTSSTEGERAELRKHYGELGGAILKPGGRIKVLGTPQTEATIYVEYAMEKGYSMRIWPIVYPTDAEMTHYGTWLDPKIRKAVQDNPALAGTSTTPHRFTEADIAARRLEWGETEFKRQFLLWTDVGSADTKPLKLRDCMVVNIPVPTPHAPLKVPSEMRWDPVAATRVADIQVDALNGDSEVFYPADTIEYREYWQKPEGIILQVDPSGSGKDECVWMAIAQHCGRVFVLGAGASLDGFGETTLKSIALTAKRWGVQRIKIEKNFGGGMFGALLRPYLMDVGHPCGIEEEFATGNKEIRMIDSLETLVSTHRLVFNLAFLKWDFHVGYTSVEDAAKRYYRLTYQFTRAIRAKGALRHDDRLDCLSSGARSFMGSLSRQLEDAARASREVQLNRDIDALIEQQRREKDALNPLLQKGEQYGRDSVGGNPRGTMADSPLFKLRNAYLRR